jgi:PPOX class probable F420-dependent enzyme
MDIDYSSEFGKIVKNHLDSDQVVWLTTVRKDGTPQPAAVWFIWKDDSFVIFTQPHTQKLKNIARNPHVSLHFNCDEDGEHVVVFLGQAFIDPSIGHNDHVSEYVAKYDAAMRKLNFTWEDVARDYSVALRIIPERVRGY